MRNRVVPGRDDAHLHVTFDDVEGSHAGVRETAGDDTAEEALGVVVGIVRHGPEVSF